MQHGPGSLTGHTALVKNDGPMGAGRWTGEGPRAAPAGFEQAGHGFLRQVQHRRLLIAIPDSRQMKGLKKNSMTGRLLQGWAQVLAKVNK